MLSESELNELKGDQIALQNELNNQKKSIGLQIEERSIKNNYTKRKI